MWLQKLQWIVLVADKLNKETLCRQLNYHPPPIKDVIWARLITQSEASVFAAHGKRKTSVRLPQLTRRCTKTLIVDSLSMLGTVFGLSTVQLLSNLLTRRGSNQLTIHSNDHRVEVTIYILAYNPSEYPIQPIDWSLMSIHKYFLYLIFSWRVHVYKYHNPSHIWIHRQNYKFLCW